MYATGKIANIALAVLTGFLALSAIGGGIGLLTGIATPPTEQLHGYFASYLIPGLCLIIVVGGSAVAAFLLLVRRETLAVFLAATSGIVIMFFEFVEVQVVGTPPGVAQFLQIFYFGLGTLIVIVALLLWLLMLRLQTA